MLIAIVPLAIFILAIVVVFGISCFRRQQGHKNQGKFLASFAYLCIFLSFFFFFFFEIWWADEISKLELEVIPLSGIVHFSADVKHLASSKD